MISIRTMISESKIWTLLWAVKSGPRHIALRRTRRVEQPQPICHCGIFSQKVAVGGRCWRP